ncbi:MAG: ATP-binding protein, partial [Psychrobacter sp.]|nr:ATP-binding protein [Psychrobacter sp.]
EADKLIDDNKYNQLSAIEFSRTGKDEIGVVNKSLSNLLAQIQRNEGQLADINQQLEIKVEERTKELRASQVQLIRSEKMATLGQMVAGVAHEVNTPLSYVQNNLEIIGQLSEQYEELIVMVSELRLAMGQGDASDEQVQQLLSKIITTTQEIEEDDLTDELKELIKDSLFGVEQITDMVLNLRNFARLDESKVKDIDLRECVESSLKIARNTIKQYEVIPELHDIPEINCSPSQINQVLVNLFNNAAQAIGNKTDGIIKVVTRSDKNNVYIDVIDNGSGMTEEVAKRLFEPFFTTKGAGEGTGLGMAISQQIMEQHNAQIEVDSKLGQGTRFTLVFPIDNKLTQEAITV